MTQISYSLKKIFAGAYPLFFFGALSSILFFACQLLLARNLSPKGFGLFSTAFVSITILAPLAILILLFGIYPQTLVDIMSGTMTTIIGYF